MFVVYWLREAFMTWFIICWSQSFDITIEISWTLLGRTKPVDIPFNIVQHLLQVPADQSKWFKPGRIVTCLWKLIVQVSVVLRKTVGGRDWRFDSLGGSHLGRREARKKRDRFPITQAPKARTPRGRGLVHFCAGIKKLNSDFLKCHFMGIWLRWTRYGLIIFS